MFALDQLLNDLRAAQVDGTLSALMLQDGIQLHPPIGQDVYRHRHAIFFSTRQFRELHHLCMPFELYRLFILIHKDQTMDISIDRDPLGNFHAIDRDTYDCDCDQDGYFSTDPVGTGKSALDAAADLIEQVRTDGAH